MIGTAALPLTPKMLFPSTMFALTRFASPLIVCVPVRYVPLLIVWLLVVGVMVAAPLVVTDAVRDTEEFPAVPALTYPAAVTFGVTETVLESVIVFVPVETEALDPVMVAGAVTVPAATLLVALPE